MKLTVDSGALKDAATWAARYLPAKPGASRPALSGLLLRAGEHGLTLVGADGDTWASADLPAEVWDDGVTVLPGKLLADIAGRLPADVPVEISISQGEALIACGSLAVAVPTAPAEDYPAVPELPAPLGDVGAGAFAQAVAQIAVAAAKDDKLPAAMGLYLETVEGGLQLSASDTYRLARTTVNLTAADGRLSGEAALVPAVALDGLARTMTGKVTLHLAAESPRSLGFAWDGRRVTMPLIDVRPVAYTRALKVHEPDAHLVVERGVLTEALARVGVIFDAGKTMPRLHLDLSAGELVLRVAGGSSPRGRASETIVVVYDGEDRGMQVNAHSLTDAVKSGRGDALRLDLTPRNSMLVRSEVDPAWVHLVILLKDAVTELAG